MCDHLLSFALRFKEREANERHAETTNNEDPVRLEYPVTTQIRRIRAGTMIALANGKDE